MLAGKEAIALKKEIWLHTPPQPPLPAVVTGIEEGVFWTSLPKDGRQVLVLQENQKIKVGISLQKGFYVAETEVLAIGKDKNKFYGLAIPEYFEVSQERQFERVDFPTNATFMTSDMTANTAMVNLSAGGVMVYLVPELEKLIKSSQKMVLSLNIYGMPFQSEVRMAWKKDYDSIPFAGFEFINMVQEMKEKLNEMIKKMSQYQI